MTRTAVITLAGSALTILVGWTLWAQHTHGPATKGEIPPYYKSEAAAKPFPKTLPPEMFPHPVIQRAYRIAREIPGVLAQQPCYCYCNRGHNHKGLLDCHRDNHSAG